MSRVALREFTFLFWCFVLRRRPYSAGVKKAQMRVLPLW